MRLYTRNNYFNENGDMQTGWKEDKDKNTGKVSWYYFNSNGYIQTGWQNINGKEYFFDYNSGEMVTGLVTDDEGKLYNLDGTWGNVKTGWLQKDDGKWYYFGGRDGESVTGWIDDNGTYYYLTPTGDIKKGWFQYGESWYYSDPDGKMQTGWIQDGSTCYYLNSKGEMEKDKWVENTDNGNWYHLGSDGKMETYWIKDNDKDYYLYSNGQMATGWSKLGENWYYFDASGEMQKDIWAKDNDGKYYYLGSDGKMESDEWMDEIDEGMDETDNELLKYQRDIQNLKNSDNMIDGAKYFGKYLWDRWPGLWGQINEQNALNMGMDPEWAKLAGDYSSTLFLEGFTTITVNGVRAYKNITTGEIIYEDSVVVGSGAGNIAKVVSKAYPEKVVNALSNYESKRWIFGNEELMLEKSGMKHILERHHPEYWNGSEKATQTFLDKDMSIDDIADAVSEVLKQNREVLIEKGTTGMYQVHGTVNGVNYTVGLNKGRIGQFFKG